MNTHTHTAVIIAVALDCHSVQQLLSQKNNNNACLRLRNITDGKFHNSVSSECTHMIPCSILMPSVNIMSYNLKIFICWLILL